MSTITIAEIRDAVRGLKRIKRGEVFQAHEVRHLLKVARKLEDRLFKLHEALWRNRHDAEKAFCQGWPKATNAPWQLNE